ncbi:hypothetical protein CGGC5_v008229 [Colletotrichum fructicola Nara gc5]|uniref:Zn(2)-C6 fungal-type domain-containing protein n=1 Tax=Colletotrichum fructicola (strain Nara gc5) TaxID=1213859 RepID=A0A7J6J4X0_COLFN|nr:hypothetical protein CGGC5_v008229 [Colletotrichum fructicola Nara gc5]
MKVRKGCWTCADRKIQCDGTRPKCQKQDLEEYGYNFGESPRSRALQSSQKLNIQPQRHINHMDLVYHFHHFAHVSLVTFGQRPYEIRDVLLSMALVHDEVSGIALFHALLAFSSLHRHGLNEQTIQLKGRALQSLSASVNYEILTPGKAAQHVAASMLLGAFEKLSLTRNRPTHPAVNPTFAILNLLSEVCDTVLDSRDLRTRNTKYQDHLQDLKSRVGNVSIESASAEPTSDSMFAVHLYQIATQIYLARLSQSPWEPAEDLDALVDAAFAGPIQSCSCEHFFPLLILACEAHRDNQSIEGVRNTVRSIWAQQDLHKDGEILMDYLGIMTTAISSGSAVPSFA